MLAVGDFMSSVIDEGGYGRFGAYSRIELERFLHLDDEDRRLIRTVPIDPPPALPQGVVVCGKSLAPDSARLSLDRLPGHGPRRRP